MPPRSGSKVLPGEVGIKKRGIVPFFGSRIWAQASKRWCLFFSKVLARG
jgi:hypothetical protein